MRRMLVAAMTAALMASPSFGEAKGKYARASAPRTQFKKASPCPANGRSSGACPGYVIDHVIPLKRGGPDKPSNMQWQTKAEAKAKDRYE